MARRRASRAKAREKGLVGSGELFRSGEAVAVADVKEPSSLFPGGWTYESVELREDEFVALAELIKKQAGINLGPEKKMLVKSRLARRLRLLGLASYEDYLAHLQADTGGKELVELLDAISTNVTSFFRQPKHFEYLSEVLFPKIVAARRRNGGRIRFWSAACSSGEEPYSIGIHACEHLADLDSWDLKILATDISGEILGRARRGTYEEEKLVDLPAAYAKRYFAGLRGEGDPRTYEIQDRVRQLVTFGRLNLMERWPMKGPFQAIFCRNVMIYFDKPTQEVLVERFRKLLEPGGILFIGHSESLTGIEHRYQSVGPATYVRE